MSVVRTKEAAEIDSTTFLFASSHRPVTTVSTPCMDAGIVVCGVVSYDDDAAVPATGEEEDGGSAFRLNIGPAAIALVESTFASKVGAGLSVFGTSSSLPVTPDAMRAAYPPAARRASGRFRQSWTPLVAMARVVVSRDQPLKQTEPNVPQRGPLASSPGSLVVATELRVVPLPRLRALSRMGRTVAANEVEEIFDDLTVPRHSDRRRRTRYIGTIVSVRSTVASLVITARQDSRDPPPPATVGQQEAWSSSSDSMSPAGDIAVGMTAATQEGGEAAERGGGGTGLGFGEHAAATQPAEFDRVLLLPSSLCVTEYMRSPPPPSPSDDPTAPPVAVVPMCAQDEWREAMNKWRGERFGQLAVLGTQVTFEVTWHQRRGGRPTWLAAYLRSVDAPQQ